MCYRNSNKNNVAGPFKELKEIINEREMNYLG